MNNVAAIIRLCYAPGVDELALRWRFNFFHDVVLPRLLTQCDVWVWVHPRHRVEVGSMDSRLKTFTVDLEHRGAVVFKDTTLKGYPWAAVHDLPRYQVQILLGSDDLLAPGFVRSSVRLLAELGDSAIVSHQPILYDWEAKTAWKTRVHPRPSPILAMRQDLDSASYSWVWAADHRHLGKLVKRVAYMDQELCAMTIHRYNDGTRIPRSAIQMETVPPWI